MRQGGAKTAVVDDSIELGADVEIGRSTYVLEAPDRMIVTDSVLKDDGSWRVFATLRFQRTP